ncbi:hypothetical protein ASE41_20295 [Streptomyces sp. Root264]|nr:hypothetical protein ASE41_20295 [Streptomyces sp. Root264]
MTLPAAGLSTDRPRSRPAAPALVMTSSAPDCRSSGAFSSSRTAATIFAPGLSCRAVSATSTAVSSRWVAMTIRPARCTSARRSTSLRVASPTTPS